jgi:carboxylesterase type B
LNLNVFTPQNQTSLPVFFWIHGGANVYGSASSYGPLENIVRRVPHVLVSVNYRLGIFGYLALKELSAADPRGVSGNYGITDQQLALKWVQANIEAFGGDRNCVTIIGQSSGGSNVFSHLASASSRGLFHRAIALSGSPNITMDRSTKESQDRDLILSRTRCAHETGEGVVDCLQNLSTSDAAAALPSRFKLFAPLYDYPNDKVGLKSREAALLYVDGKTITMTIEEALKSGLNDVPVLIQSTQAELDTYPVPALLNISEERLSDFFSKEFAPAYGPKMATQVHEMYQDFVNIDPEYAAYAVDSDTASSCGVRQLVMTAALGFSSPVYWGLVTGPPSKPVGKRRFPYHNWDVEAATGTYSDGYHPSSEDEAFGSRILHSWSDLATNGHLDKEQWTPAQKAAAGHAVGSLVEKKRTQPINDLKLSECAFWKSAGIAKNWWWIN